MVEFITTSAEETIELGRRLGSMLQAGDLVCLYGGLGTGKTAFTGGIAGGLGITGYITSPTFTLVNEYTGRIQLYHFDVYRISDPEEMFEIGFEEYLEGEGAVVIEWAELIEEILPEGRISVHIDKLPAPDTDKRSIRIECNGARYENCERRLFP